MFGSRNDGDDEVDDFENSSIRIYKTLMECREIHIHILRSELPLIDQQRRGWSMCTRITGAPQPKWTAARYIRCRHSSQYA